MKTQIVIFLLLIFTGSLFGADLLHQNFQGHYRKTSKTSIVRNSNGTISSVHAFANLSQLKNALGDDQVMRTNHPNLNNGQSNALRTVEERRNVEVVAWLYDARHESDNDFHLILGSSPTRSSAMFMNSEISGLPAATGDNLTRLQAARQQFLDLVPSGKFLTSHNAAQPKKVRVRGSVLFDGDHQFGCGTCPGPADAKPQTVWEIHPIISIEVIQ